MTQRSVSEVCLWISGEWIIELVTVVLSIEAARYLVEALAMDDDPMDPPASVRRIYNRLDPESSQGSVKELIKLMKQSGMARAQSGSQVKEVAQIR